MRQHKSIHLNEPKMTCSGHRRYPSPLPIDLLHSNLIIVYFRVKAFHFQQYPKNIPFEHRAIPVVVNVVSSRTHTDTDTRNKQIENPANPKKKSGARNQK